MATSLNKTDALTLANKAGINVNKGDVVVLDLLTASSFTITGSSQLATRTIGVVLDTGGIVTGSSGLIAINGYVPQINLLSGATIGQTINLSNVAGKAMPHSNVLPGDFGQVLSAGTTPDAILWGSNEYRGEFVGCRYYAITGSLNNNTETFFGIYNTRDYDTHNAFSTGTSNSIANGCRFTAPMSGYYNIHIMVLFANASWIAGTYTETYFYINGTNNYYMLSHTTADSTSSNYRSANGSITLFLNKGDFITPSVYQSSGGTLTLFAPQQYTNYVEIIKVG